MIFRFTLSNDTLGRQEISEPDGWKDAVLKLERHEEFHSLIEYFDGEFIFYGDNGQDNGGIDYIKAAEQLGINEEVTITIELSFDGVDYETLFIGQLDLSALEQLSDNKMKVPIIRTDFWAKFVSRLDTPVDLQSYTNVDGENVVSYDSISLRLTSQKIQKQHYSYITNGYQFETPDDIDSTWYQQYGFDYIELGEIDEIYTLPTSDNPERPVWFFAPEYSGDYDFEIRIELSLNSALGDWNNVSGYIKLYLQVNDNTPTELNRTNYSNSPEGESSVFRYNGVLSLNQNDVVRLYGDYQAAYDGLAVNQNLVVWGVDNDLASGASGTFPFSGPDLIPSRVTIPSYIRITGQTIFEETNAESFLVHDAGAAISDRIIGENSTFYSEYLGSSDTVARQYDSNGCAWTYTVTKGLQLRQYNLREKPFFLSFKQWWSGLNPILNLGLGYDTIGGNDVIRVEEKEYFYDDSATSMDFSNVRDIRRVYDKERLFNKIDIGYKKWQAEDISGIDDPQTKHTYSTILKRAGQGLQIESDFIAASLAIETTRRQTRLKSADYKFDNDTFIISINPQQVEVSPETSPDVSDYQPELAENFSSITNLLNSETRYNSRITPARNLLRWLNFIQGCLQDYASNPLKFTSGEGNYDMVSELADTTPLCGENYDSVSEKGNISITSDYLHLPLAYEITLPLEWEEYLTIRNNRTKPIGISQTDTGFTKFFIKTLEYKVVSGVAVINAWPTEFMDIGVIDSTVTMYDCVAPVAEYRLLENGDFRITESGDFRILE